MPGQLNYRKIALPDGLLNLIESDSDRHLTFGHRAQIILAAAGVVRRAFQCGD